MIMSLVGVAAFLPVVMFGVLGEGRLQLSSRADSDAELRTWFEPAEVIVKSGQTATVQLVADYSDTANLVPSLKAKWLKSDNSLEISPTEVSYIEPFSGKVSLGEIKIKARRTGTYTVEMDTSSVFTGLPTLSVVSSPVTVIVR